MTATALTVEDLGTAPHRGAVAEVIAAIEKDRAFFAARTSAGTPSWVDLERIATAELNVARLTGELDAFSRADAALVRAFAHAPAGSGPLATRAQLHLTLHRLEPAMADIAQALKIPLSNAREIAALIALRGDVEFQQGQYAKALASWKDAEGRVPTAGTLARLAQYHWKMGAPAKALELLTEAEGRAKAESPLSTAWTLLQSAMISMDGGRLEEAAAKLDKASAAFPGWYLIDEHRAEILASRGRLDEAQAAYEDVLRRVPRAEFMAALAGVLEARGAVSEADQWMERATAAYERELAAFPEAAGAHALEHFLQLEGEGAEARALELARRSAEGRAYGASQVQLAQALLRNGKLAEATKIIAQVRRTPWRTADFHATASILHHFLGQTAKAGEERHKADALCPGATEEMAQWLRPAASPPATGEKQRLLDPDRGSR